MKRKKEGSRRTGDAKFTWLIPQLGESFRPWVALAAEWMSKHKRSVDARQHSLSLLFDRYMTQQKLPVDPSRFFSEAKSFPSFWTVCCSKALHGASYNNHAKEFLDWVLATQFSEQIGPDEWRVRAGFVNPISTRSIAAATFTESVRNPLPYRYITELRNIVAPGRNFSDWIWAQDACRSDWFEVDPTLVNREDPDCVWRERTLSKKQITELWCPARLMVIFTKLLVPLRTYQVRMLDSGEADTWKYHLGAWIPNEGTLTTGSLRKPTRHGIFRRVVDAETNEERTALYVNSNKTADSHRDATNRGYVIPWQHDELLYWLEKMRNWQERYNPLKEPTSWTTLDVGHLGNAKSMEVLASMPPTCFLFRQASAKEGGKDKPIPDTQVDIVWYRLLKELETRCAARKETLTSGRPLQFVYPNSMVTHYPMHSLRVSLLTCMALDGEVPIPILSKLVAGHSRLIMTLYYIKAGTGRISNLLKEAESRLDNTAEASLQKFLEEASYEELLNGAVANNDESLRLALSELPGDRNPTGWSGRSYGICLGGSNSSAVEGRRVIGCHNGGQRLNGEGANSLYTPVPGGAGNCIRCRWLITEPRYLDALRAHFNNISYRLSESAMKSRELEIRLDKLKGLKAEVESQGLPYLGQAEYLQVERLWETGIAETDGLANDLVATLQLIGRCLALLQKPAEDGKQQLISVGSNADVQMALEETSSELLQLVEVCSDAEVYPDESPAKAILRRSQILDSALYREGLPPVFFSFTEDEQLRLGNHLMNRLKTLQVRGEREPIGLKRVVGLLESQQRLSDVLEIDPQELFSFNQHLPSAPSILTLAYNIQK